jgi:hypothetical protein
MRAAEHSPRDPFRLLERRHGLVEIVECGAVVQVLLQYLVWHLTHRGASWASGAAQAAQVVRIILRFAVLLTCAAACASGLKNPFFQLTKNRRATPSRYRNLLQHKFYSQLSVGRGRRQGSGRSGRSPSTRASSSAVLGARPRRRRRDESGFWSELLAACASASFRRSRATRSGE